MKVYLVQHGEARSKEEDPERHLTDKGIKDAEEVAGLVRERYAISVEKIIHSGKTRAIETAGIFAKYINPVSGVLEEKGLAPLDDPIIWAEKLLNAKEDIMIVGHLPYLSKLASLLLIGDQEQVIVKFQMAGVVCLERNADGQWHICWMTVPRMKNGVDK